MQTSIVVVHALLVAPQLSSWTRDWASVPCISWQILNHWTTIEVPYWFLRHLHLYSIISPKQIFFNIKMFKRSKWHLMRMLRIVYCATFSDTLFFPKTTLFFATYIHKVSFFTFCLASSWKPKLNDNRVIACLIQYINTSVMVQSEHVINTNEWNSLTPVICLNEWIQWFSFFLFRAL